MPTSRWSLERSVSAIAGSVVIASLVLGRTHSSRWRLLTAFVGANLVLNGFVGWCPTSLLLHRLGIPREAELATEA